MSESNSGASISTEDTGPIEIGAATGGAPNRERGHRPVIPHTIRILAVPIILG
ncbi:conserved transmembrane transport domain protein [Mycobacterium ulcerans str. Harvey]|nr:conserved transmembrane transport domain protein [Mycobacterium ulcerans str. Harvey]